MVLPVEMDDDLCLRCARDTARCRRCQFVMRVARRVGEPHKVTECGWFREKVNV